jgi:hypothetical protein
MAKTFRKLDRVAVLSNWDSKGGVRIRRAVVHSCGAKVMRLQDDAGEMFKVAFTPGEATTGRNISGVVADADNATLEALAIEVGAHTIASGIEQKLASLAHYGERAGAGYIAALNRDLDVLRAARPWFFWSAARDGSDLDIAAAAKAAAFA